MKGITSGRKAGVAIASAVLAATLAAGPGVAIAEPTTSAPAATSSSNDDNAKVDLTKLGYEIYQQKINIQGVSAEDLQKALATYQVLWNNEYPNSDNQHFKKNPKYDNSQKLIHKFSGKDDNYRFLRNAPGDDGKLRAKQALVAFQLSYDHSKWEGQESKIKNQGITVNDQESRIGLPRGEINMEGELPIGAAQSIFIRVGTGGMQRNNPSLDDLSKEHFNLKDLAKMMGNAGLGNGDKRIAPVWEAFAWKDQRKEEPSRYMKQAAWALATDFNSSAANIDPDELLKRRATGKTKDALELSNSIYEKLKNGEVSIDSQEVTDARGDIRVRAKDVPEGSDPAIKKQLDTFVSSVDAARKEAKTNETTSASESNTARSSGASETPEKDQKPAGQTTSKSDATTEPKSSEEPEADAPAEEPPADLDKVVAVNDLQFNKPVTLPGSDKDQWYVYGERVSKNKYVIDKQNPKEEFTILEAHKVDLENSKYVSTDNINEAKWVKIKTSNGKVGYVSATLFDV